MDFRAQVKNRLNLHKQKREREAAAALDTDPTKHFQEYEDRMRKLAEDEEADKLAKKERKKAKKEASVAEASAAAALPAEDEDGMMAAMGFAGFGTSKKS